MHFVDCGSQGKHLGIGQQRPCLRDQFAPVGAGQQGAFGFRIRIAQGQAQQEAVQLRIRQWIGAGQVHRILRGDDEERVGEGTGRAIQGDLVLGHGFQQGALGARRRTVDFIGQQHMGEHRTGMELELPRLRVVYRYTQYVGRQQVRSKLYALETQPQGSRQCMGKRGLAQSGQVFDQDMPAGQQGDERQPHLLWLAQYQ